MSKKLKHKRDCQNLMGQSYKLYIQTNLKQIQGRKPCIQTTEYLQDTKRKNNS
jgi:hypothetical protein